MSRFLLFYFIVYGGMHLYLFLKVRSAFSGVIVLHVAVGLFCVVMIAAPLAARTLDRTEHDYIGHVVALAGYFWLVMLFWFCCLALIADFWNLWTAVVAYFAPAARKAILPSRPAFAVIGCLILIGCVWGWFEAANVRLKTVVVRTPRLVPGSKPIRIAQISDLHVSLVLRDGRAERAIELARRANPDVLVCTGDMVDASYEHIRHVADLFAGVRPPLGKFAVFGNHEYYADVGNSEAFYRAAGFRVLREESVIVDGWLRIAGVEDGAGGHNREKIFTNEEAVLSPFENRELTVLLKHRPDARKESLGRFDLQLSGHTHGGQVFPFWYFVRHFYPLTPGLHQLEKGSAIYVSRGAGTWGPPLRLFAPPEVTLIILEPMLV